jgi:tryptophan synthase alpha chain
VLQRSLEIGLKAGASLPRAFEIVAEFRQEYDIPVILYGYYNPIFRYGPERFARDAAKAGIDGILVVDLPPDEAAEVLAFTRPQGIHFVCLLAPTSDRRRIATIEKHPAGFRYYFSVTGVTGAKPMHAETVEPVVRGLRQHTKLPIGVGFGISTPQQAGAVAAFADAAVLGSAIMRLVDQHRGQSDLVREVGLFIRSIKEGMRDAKKAAAPAG